MEERLLDAVLLTSPENVFYATGYTALPSSGNPILYTLRNRLPYFALVTAEGEVTLGCWGFSAEGVEFGVDRLRGFNESTEAGAMLVEELKRLGPGARIGIESSCPAHVCRLAGTVSPDLDDADPVMNALRRIKSPAEFDLIRASTTIIETAVERLYEELELGMSRLDVMRRAREHTAALGATGLSHLTFSFGQSNPEIAIDEPLTSDTLVTLDIGAILDGYCSDSRRYAYTGPVPDASAETYRHMVEIVDAVGALLIPGARYSDIFATALDLQAERGVVGLERLTHVGHHIGLETEEEWLTDVPDRTLAAGMAINIELYTLDPAGQQIGNEETYLIGPAGPERISILEREIRSIR
jgi:Xaa-Pro dipeptidase